MGKPTDGSLFCLSSVRSWLTFACASCSIAFFLLVGAPVARAAAEISVNFLPAGTNPDYSDEVCLAWTDSAKSAVTKAANTWSNLLTSTQTINIDACWAKTLPSGTIARGAPFGTWCRDFSGAKVSGTRYPPALANALAKKDLDPATAEIYISFDSSLSWGYTETDVKNLNLITYALHVIGHGIGFASSMSYDTTNLTGKWGGHRWLSLHL